MRCEFCGQIAPDNYVQCPNCNSWNAEIDRTETKIYYLLGIALTLIALILLPAIANPIGDLLLLFALLVLLVVVGGTVAKLRRLMKGSHKG